MGVWGTAISSNDTYKDIYDEFFDLYNKGFEVTDVSNKLIAKNKKIINDPEDCNNFWFAIAKAQWDCKQLDPELFLRIKEIVDTGSDIEVWRRLKAEERDIKKRIIVLDKFLVTLKSEKTRAKSRKKSTIRQPVFEKGDCLTFKLKNGNYGGAVVLEAIKDTKDGPNLIAITRINQENKPEIKNFENAKVLIKNFSSWDNEPAIDWYIPVRHKNISHLIEKVGSIEVTAKYPFENFASYGIMADFDIWIIEIANSQFDSEKTNTPPKKELAIKTLTKRKWWKVL